MKSCGKCRVTVSCTLYSHFGRTDIPSRNLWVVGVAMSHRLSEKALGHRFIDDPEKFLDKEQCFVHLSIAGAIETCRDSALREITIPRLKESVHSLFYHYGLSLFGLSPRQRGVVTYPVKMHGIWYKE